MHAAIHSLYEKKLCLKNSFSHTFYGLFLIFSLPYLYFYAITTSSQFYRQSIGPSLSLNDLILKNANTSVIMIFDSNFENIIRKLSVLEV